MSVPVSDIEAELVNRLSPEELSELLKRLLPHVRQPPPPSPLPSTRVRPPQRATHSDDTSPIGDTQSNHPLVARQPLLDQSVASLHSRPPVQVTTRLVKNTNANGHKFLNGYRIIREIGRGSCGKVNLAVSKEDGRHVAIKYVRRAENKRKIGGPTAAQMNYNAFMREVAVMKMLRHKNIVSVYEVIDDPDADKMYLVMQYVDHGPIAHIEVTNGTDIVCDPIPPGELAGYAQQMLAGLEYLHRHNVVHRDIKPDNILVDKSRCVYLADFGVAETFDTQYRERMERRMMKSMAQSMAMSMAGGRAAGPLVLGPHGTMLFIAPELWAGARIPGKPVDMWAMGVTLYTLLTGTLPFSNLDEIRNPNLPVIPTAYGSKWGDLLQGLLNRDPHHRLTAAEAWERVKNIPQEVECITSEAKQREVLVSQRRQVAAAIVTARGQTLPVLSAPSRSLPAVRSTTGTAQKDRGFEEDGENDGPNSGLAALCIAIPPPQAPTGAPPVAPRRGRRFISQEMRMRTFRIRRAPSSIAASVSHDTGVESAALSSPRSGTTTNNPSCTRTSEATSTHTSTPF